MKIQLIIHADKFEISEYNRKAIKQCVRDNDNKPVRAILESLSPESRKVRGYCMGGLIPLIIYLDGNDYNDTKTNERYFEFLKRELAPELLKINGKMEVFGKSTKGSKALNAFSEKLQDYLNEQYGIAYDSKAINPEEYKKFRDEIFPYQLGYKDWIDYCRDMLWITRII